MLIDKTRYEQTEKGWTVSKASSLSAVAAFLLIAVSLALVSYVWGFGEMFAAIAEGFLSFKILMCVVICIVATVVYVFLIALCMQFFCEDRWLALKLKMVDSVQLPTCHCSESLRPWQFIVSFLVPMIVTRLPVLIMSLLTCDFTYIFSLVILIFLSGLDVVLICRLSAMQFSGEYKYVSVNNHIFNLTLYKEIETE